MAEGTDLTCAVCAKRMARGVKSKPQGEATCHPCRRQRRKDITCVSCGKAMDTQLPQGQAKCLRCRQADPKPRWRPPRKPTVRVCPMCRRTFEHPRRTYCGPFCRLMGSRLGNFRDLFIMQGSYHQAVWWYRTPEDPRYFIGPCQALLDIWVRPDDIALCPQCGGDMGYPIPAGVECNWCGIKAITLPPVVSDEDQATAPSRELRPPIPCRGSSGEG